MAKATNALSRESSVVARINSFHAVMSAHSASRRSRSRGGQDHLHERVESRPPIYHGGFFESDGDRLDRAAEREDREPDRSGHVDQYHSGTSVEDEYTRALEPFALAIGDGCGKSANRRPLAHG